MKRKLLILTALVMTVTMLSGCGLLNAAISLIAPDVTEANDLPHLMVRQIDVAMYPGHSEFDRHYESQENLTTILQLLRKMETDTIPGEQPRLSDGQTYYAVTATYASGEQQLYYVMGYQFMRIGEDPWCEIEFDRAMGFVDYLRSHPSDNGTYIPPETLPSETQPPESTPDETGTAPTGEQQT